MKHLNVILLIFMIIVAQNTLAQSAPIVLVKMRDSGYTMGDFINMQVEISLPENHKIDSESLPLTGRVKPWLDLHTIKIHQKANDKVHLELIWQIFASVEIAQTLKTPEVTLKTLAKKPQNIQIPAQSFYYSPVLPYPLGEVSRRPDLPPDQFDERTPRFWTLILLGLCALGALLCLWFKDLLPWWPYHPGPMTKLARSLKRKAGNELQINDLRNIHAALNATANESLYPHTLANLFIRAPYLESEKAAIGQFFNASWLHFYAPKSLTNITDSSAKIDLKATMNWIQNAALSERIFRRNASRKAASRP